MNLSLVRGDLNGPVPGLRILGTAGPGEGIPAVLHPLRAHDAPGGREGPGLPGLYQPSGRMR